VREKRASRTAFGVARGLLFLSTHEHLASVLPPRAAEITRAFVFAVSKAVRHEYRWMKRRGLYRLLAAINERFLIPGSTLHVGFRKRFFNDRVNEALDAGATQLVVLGAGFDTLATRVADARANVRCLEIDHPATQAVKRKGLDALGGDRPNLHLVEVDFARTSAAEVLEHDDRFDRTAKSVFVAEGLLMYLAEDDVRRLFRFARTHSAPGSRVCFSFVGRHDDGRPHAGPHENLINALLKLAGEPIHWGIEPDRLGEFLAAEGFTLECQATDTALAADLLPDRSLWPREFLDWELYGVAESRANGGM